MIAPVPAQRVVTLWLPVAAWAALIFALSSIPGLSTGLGTWDVVLRKAAHITEYAILGALLMRALDRPAVAATLAIAYAATDELHQHFVPGRAGTMVDVAVDAVGVVLGVVLYRGARS
jgi:VanZ family protein